MYVCVPSLTSWEGRGREGGGEGEREEERGGRGEGKKPQCKLLLLMYSQNGYKSHFAELGMHPEYSIIGMHSTWPNMEYAGPYFSQDIL